MKTIACIVGSLYLLAGFFLLFHDFKLWLHNPTLLDPILWGILIGIGLSFFFKWICGALLLLLTYALFIGEIISGCLSIDGSSFLLAESPSLFSAACDIALASAFFLPQAILLFALALKRNYKPLELKIEMPQEESQTQAANSEAQQAH